MLVISSIKINGNIECEKNNIVCEQFNYNKKKKIIMSPVGQITQFMIIIDFTERRNGVILTQKVESLAELKFDTGFQVIGEHLSQIDSILRVNFTQIFSNYSEFRVEF